MAGGRRVAVLVLLVVGATLAGAVPAAAGAPATDSTVTRITVAANGTATWEVQVRTRLATEADVDDYERFQERFRENTSEYLGPFRERMRGVVRDAANATGRPMEARDFQAETSVQAVPRRWGVVTYEFSWVHFAARDDAALVVGDVFRGQFFLTRNDTLQVAGPDDYVVANAEPAPTETEPGLVRWFGRRTFADDRPMVRFEPSAGTGTDGGDSSTATSDDSNGSGGDGNGASGTANDTPGSAGGGNGPGTSTDGNPTAGGSGLQFALGVLAVGVVGVGAYRYYRRSGGAGSRVDDPGAAGESSSDGGPIDDATGGRSREGDHSGEAGESPGGSDDVGEGDAPDGTGDGQPDDSAGTATDLEPGPVVTDPDRVERVLRDHGGQLRQSDVVEALDWSKSKTSRVLSDMADEDRVEKLRIGRENVIRLPGESDDWTDADE